MIGRVFVAVLLALCFVGVSAASVSDAEAREEFTNFMHNYKKTYQAHEFQYRYGVFKNNLQLIREHNDKTDKTFTLAVNHLADLTLEEYRYRMLGYRHEPRRERTKVQPINVKDLPDSVDWRTKNVVTPIKDQGQCGSCWAFSATGSMEGANAIKTGTLVSLSEQQLVDCSRSYGNMGCNGGLMDYAFEYVINNGGIDTEDSYPYQSGTGNDFYQCRYSGSNRGAKISDYHQITEGSEEALQKAVANVGPISVAIDAGHSSFQFYHSGIYYEPHCSSYQLDHGVLAIGYGSNGTADYWLVKNSWGTSWGDQGLIKMMRNKNNHCGIATMASYPVV